MSLALVTVASSDFELVHDHLSSHKPPYRNMHMREACQRDGRRDLRYLHAMYAPPGAQKIVEGMISGPEVLWHYRLLQTKSRTQLNVLREQGSPQARNRIRRRFLVEILNRIDDERAAGNHHPTRTHGQFYLRRKVPGMPASHPKCQQAVAEGMLAQLFVSRLSDWGFELLHP